MRRPLLLITCALALGLLALLNVAGSSPLRDKYPYRFLIPEGYVGWVRIDFNVKDAPPLPVEDGFYVVKIPDTGRLKTSLQDTLTRRDEFYYFADDTKYPLSINSQNPTCMIQQRFWGPPLGHATPNHYRYFFVGPREIYERCTWNEPCNERYKDGYLKAGPWLVLTREQLEQARIRQP